MPSNGSNIKDGEHRIDLVCEAGGVTIEAAQPVTAGEEGGSEELSLPRFTMVAYTGGPMQVAGWRHPVVVDFEGLQINAQRRPIRFAHSAYQGVGHTERIAMQDGRLIAEGVVSRDTPAAREIVASGKRGFPWQASIGAAVQEAELIRAGRSVSVNGRTFEGPVFGGRVTTRDYRTGKRVTRRYRGHAYMGPALEKEADKFPALWRDSVRGNLDR